MAPAPLQKTPQISPISKADTVRLHVSREKDGKLRLVAPGVERRAVPFAAPAAKAAVIVLTKERDRIEVLRSLDRAAPTHICG